MADQRVPRTMSVSRRTLLRGAAALSAAGAWAYPRSAALAQATAAPDPKAAAGEGPLVIWHPDQEGDVVQFLKIFTDKTGIQTVQQRLLPGAAVPKLEAELRTGTTDLDAIGPRTPASWRTCGSRTA
jgi:spermidine/putrescine-binding protein